MAHYTKELREIINDGFDIFNFDYNFYNPSYKKKFEEKFIKHFYFREIGFETVGRFIHELNDKLEEIYPYYEHLYRTTLYEYDPILNYNVTEEISRKLDEVASGKSKGSSIKSGASNSKATQYDTPITKINSSSTQTPSFINEGVSSASDTSTDTAETNSSNNTNENQHRTMKGNIGVMTTQDLIMKERQIIVNIDKLIFEECENLFMMIF